MLDGARLLDDRHPSLAALLLTGLGGGALVVRRRAPLPVLATTVAAAIAVVAVGEAPVVQAAISPAARASPFAYRGTQALIFDVKTYALPGDREGLGGTADVAAGIVDSPAARPGLRNRAMRRPRV